MSLRKACARLSDWFVIQSSPIKVLVMAAVLFIPASAIYSVTLLQKQAAIAEQVKVMGSTESTVENTWSFNAKVPVVFGTGSLLGFLDSNPADRITIIYKPLMWNVSERIVLIESKGKQ